MHHVKNYIYIFLVIFLVISITPVNANNLGEAQKDAEKHFQELETLQNFDPNKLGWKEKMKAIFQLPKLKDQINNLPQESSKKVKAKTQETSDEKPGPIPDKITDLNDNTTKTTELENSRNRVVDYCNSQSGGYYNIVAVQKAKDALVPGDIVQIIDKKGYIRYIAYTGTTDGIKQFNTTVYDPTTMTFNNGVCGIDAGDFDIMYQGYVIQVVNLQSEYTNRFNWALSQIARNQDDIIRSSEQIAEKNIKIYDEKYKVAIWMVEHVIWALGILAGLIIAAAGPKIGGLIVTFFIWLFSHIIGYAIIPAAAGAGAGGAGAGGAAGGAAAGGGAAVGGFTGFAALLGLTPAGLITLIVILAILLAILITIIVSFGIYYQCYLPMVEPWKNNVKDLETARKDLNNWYNPYKNQLSKIKNQVRENKGVLVK